MRRHNEERATAVVVLLSVVGVLLVAAASYTALKSFNHAQYDCGSVILPEDPRDLVSKRATVPPALADAHDKCEARRAPESAQARTLLICGAAALAGALAAPTLARRVRRFRRHLRSRRS